MYVCVTYCCLKGGHLIGYILKKILTFALLFKILNQTSKLFFLTTFLLFQTNMRITI